MGSISHGPQHLLRGTLLSCRSTNQRNHFPVIPRKVYVLARVEQTLLEDWRNIVVDLLYCCVTSAIIDVFGVHVQGLIAVASHQTQESSHVVPAGRATICQLRHDFYIFGQNIQLFYRTAGMLIP